MKPAVPVQKPFNLILLGDPASGKGTQAVRLVKKYRFYDLDMGHEVRKPAAREQFDFAETTAVGTSDAHRSRAEHFQKRDRGSAGAARDPFQRHAEDDQRGKAGRAVA